VIHQLTNSFVHSFVCLLAHLLICSGFVYSQTFKKNDKLPTILSHMASLVAFCCFNIMSSLSCTLRKINWWWWWWY